MSDAVRKALADVLADIEDYERVNNLAPNPGKPDCWQSVTRARAALAEPEWRPISEAPKDGTEILVIMEDNNNLGPLTMVWLEHVEGWRMSFDHFDVCAEWDDEPDLWMPLPSPPTGGAR